MGAHLPNTNLALSGANDHQTFVQDYLVGKKYFEHIVARGVISHLSHVSDATALDSAMITAIQRFPHDLALRSLQARGLVVPSVANNSDENVTRFMVLMGRVDRTQIYAEKQRIEQEALQFIFSGLRDASDANGRGLVQNTRRSTSRTPPPAEELGKYMTALKEHCDHYAKAFRTTPVQTPEGIMGSRGEVVCGNSSFQATARNRKMAYHMAAYRACQTLGIEVK